MTSIVSMPPPPNPPCSSANGRPNSPSSAYCAHKARLQDLSATEHAEIQQTLGELVDVYDRLIRADGYNVGLNLGSAAGAGLPGHLHWHLVPRWHGDTNFMPVLADTKVIVQSLDTLYDLLTARLHPGADGGPNIRG